MSIVLHEPNIYFFDRSSVGETVMFKDKVTNTVHLFTVVFNTDHASFEEDEILFKNLITGDCLTIHDICVKDYVYVILKESLSQE